ncbi:MAG TPA: cytochrome C oxidase subunit IV family protein [Thermoanaerobaculia bacterium]
MEKFEHEPSSHKHAPAHHVTSLPVYFGIFFALMVLTVLTVVASRVDLGVLNTPIAMLIAIVKCLLVILWFMHVIHSPKLTWVVVIASFLWLGVMFVLTFADYLTRYWNIY